MNGSVVKNMDTLCVWLLWTRWMQFWQICQTILQNPKTLLEVRKYYEIFPEFSSQNFLLDTSNDILMRPANNLPLEVRKKNIIIIFFFLSLKLCFLCCSLGNTVLVLLCLLSLRLVRFCRFFSGCCNGSTVAYRCGEPMNLSWEESFWIFCDMDYWC